MSLLFGGLAITLYFLVRNSNFSYAASSVLTLVSTGMGFVLSSILLVLYDTTTPFFIINFGIGGGVFLDGIGMVLVWLTFFIALLCSLYSYNVVGFSYRIVNGMLLLMTLLLTIVFTVRNLLEFYLYFEAVLMPMVGLVLLGSRGRKVHATLLFFFYTFSSAILLLTGIGFVYLKLGTLDFVDFQFSHLAIQDQLIVFGLFFGGFAVKVPLIPFHLWLPEAHVEAPTIGSVFLAAILLKLGTYGMYRTLFTLCEFETLSLIKPVVIPFLMVSLLASSLTAVRQIDIKKIVAYSSIAHMSFSLLGLISANQLGITGFLFLMLTHGLISANMFFSVGMLYDRFHTRNIMYYGGLVQFMPLFSTLYFVVIFSNLSLPSTCNFVGELLVLYSVWPTAGIFTILVVLLGLLFVVIFCLVLLYRVLFYQISGLLTTNLIDVTAREFLILTILNIYIILFGLNPNQVLELLWSSTIV